MAKERFQCENGHEAMDFSRSRLWFAAMNWEPDYRCQQCDGSVRWSGERPTPKAVADRQVPVRYEVLYIARLEHDAPDGERWKNEGYFPFVMVSRLSIGGEIELRPRYYLRTDYADPNSAIKYGQDGPIFSRAEWMYITGKIRAFLLGEGIPM